MTNQIHSKRVFRPTLWWLGLVIIGITVFLWLAGISFLLVQLALGRAHAPTIRESLALAAFLAVSIVAMFAVFPRTIIVTPEQITYTHLGYTISAKWIDADHISRNWMVAIRFWWAPNAGDLLILRKSVVTGHPLMLEYIYMESLDRVIPVGEIDADWRLGEIGDTIREYAPHVRF